MAIVARDCAEEQLASTEKSQPFGQVSDDRDHMPRNAACFRIWTSCEYNNVRFESFQKISRYIFLNDYKNIAQNSPLNDFCCDELAASMTAPTQLAPGELCNRYCNAP